MQTLLLILTAALIAQAETIKIEAHRMTDAQWSRYQALEREKRELRGYYDRDHRRPFEEWTVDDFIGRQIEERLHLKRTEQHAKDYQAFLADLTGGAPNPEVTTHAEGCSDYYAGKKKTRVEIRGRWVIIEEHVVTGCAELREMPKP